MHVVIASVCARSSRSKWITQVPFIPGDGHIVMSLMDIPGGVACVGAQEIGVPQPAL